MIYLVRVVLATLVALIALVAWTVIGLFYWIPLLARTCAAFTASMMISAISNRTAPSAGKALDEAFLFYLNGFIRIWHAIDSLYSAHLPPADETKPASFDLSEFLISVFVVLWQTFIAVLFWAGLAFVLSDAFRDWLAALHQR